MMALPGGIPGLAFRALERVAAGRWRPLVSTYPLGEAARAHADLEARLALGKVVLQPASPVVEEHAGTSVRLETRWPLSVRTVRLISRRPRDRPADDADTGTAESPPPLW